MAAFTLIQKISDSAISAATPAWAYPPSTAKVSYNDVSSPDAGRTLDGIMHKERIGTCVKIEMKWNYINSTTAQAILAAFQPEYINVQYFDPRTATTKTKTFYSGDRGAGVYNSALDLFESITVNIIEQTPHN